MEVRAERDSLVEQDLAICVHGANVTPDQYLNTVPFMDEIAKRLKSTQSRM